MKNSANHVSLTGRLSTPPEKHELPSGDLITSFRIVVPRPRRTKSKQKVDVFDCTAWTAAARRAAGRFGIDDIVHVEGQVRRSFRSRGGASTSFVGIDVDRCTRAA